MGPFEFGGEDGEACWDDEESGAWQNEQGDSQEQDDAADDSDNDLFGGRFQNYSKMARNYLHAKGLWADYHVGRPLLLDGNCGGVFKIGGACFPPMAV